MQIATSQIAQLRWYNVATIAVTAGRLRDVGKRSPFLLIAVPSCERLRNIGLSSVTLTPATSFFFLLPADHFQIVQFDCFNQPHKYMYICI